MENGPNVVGTARSSYGERPTWHPERPRLRPLWILVSWLAMALALLIAAAIVPGVTVPNYADALGVVALIAILNALLPPIVAALRLPYTIALGFVLVLILDAFALVIAGHIDSQSIQVSSFWSALLTSLVAGAVAVILQVLLGISDDNEFALRVVERIARRQGLVEHTTAPGIIYLEIDGLALPVLQHAIRSGSAPNMARWIADDGYRLDEWETDLSSQTGASQAGILLGSNTDISAFRWVEKETGRLMTCSAPQDCAEIEKRHSTGNGLLTNGGASRGNLLSGEAEAVILTASRISDEKKTNPGYRAFLANGYNVTRTLVLFIWEVVLEWMAAAQQRRRDVLPRGHRGGIYPFLRAALCVGVRDLIVYGVLTDMMRGRPAVYATFSSYDEVAHHSGLERADTLEALRKLDQQFGRIYKSRRYAPRPYEIVVLSDHGQTQGATFKQRNGYGLEDLVERSIEGGSVTRMQGGDENSTAVGRAVNEATGRGQKDTKHAKNDVSGQDLVVLGSGNLGLIYLMGEKRRLTLEEIQERYPRLVPALCEHPHIGWILVHSSKHGPMALGRQGVHYLSTHRLEGEDPLALFSPSASHHLRRADAFPHVADIMVNSFYDPVLEEGCAFEELISFHGGMGGPQTRPFLLYPATLNPPPGRIVGAAAVHDILLSWRHQLEGEAAERDGQPAEDRQVLAASSFVSGSDSPEIAQS